MPETTPPRWDLSNVYPGLDSPEFLAGTNQRESMLTEMEALLTSLESLDDKSDAELVADRILYEEKGKHFTLALPANSFH